MIALFRLLLAQVLFSLKSRAELQAENFALRHQIEILKRSAPKRLTLKKMDRLIFIWLLRIWPRSKRLVHIVHPKTLVRWHREGFRYYWRWRSRRPLGRPRVSNEIRALVRQMRVQNPLWGAPRIHGELLKLGFNVSQATVSRYMPRRTPDPDQAWLTCLHNHLNCTASIDFLVVPTLTFKILFVLVVLSYDRRKVVHFGATANPTAEWTAQQITEAFPWDEAPRFLIRDRHRTYGQIFRDRVTAMGIADAPTAPRSPWQNGYVERVIGSIRRECLDHIIALDERHLRRTLKSYFAYYNKARTHLALNKDAPIPRPIAQVSSGRVVAIPEVGGLHHRYERLAA